MEASISRRASSARPGVHRGGGGDVSADLVALSRIPVAVVCAGAKAVLDLPRTVEALETLGVPILGYRTARFPAFDRRDSGLDLDQACGTLADLARAVALHLEMDLGGVVVANPIAPEHEVPEALHE